MGRERRVRVTTICIAALAGLLTVGAGRCETVAPRSRHYVLFIDLSLSLNATQTDSLPRVLDSIVRGLPSGAHVVAFPISERVVAAGPLLRTTLPRGENATERVKLRKRRNELTGDLLRAIESMRTSLSGGTALRSTCVSDAIRQAAKEALDARPYPEQAIGDLEIIFLSDMLEHCSTSLLGKPVSLEKKDIGAEIALALAVPRTKRLANLRGGRVTVLLPPLSLAQPGTRRPEEHELEEFWRLIFDRCNDDREAFRFGTSVPERLRAESLQ